MDRASLVRRRQQMRAKENTTNATTSKKLSKPKKKKDAGRSSARGQGQRAVTAVEPCWLSSAALPNKSTSSVPTVTPPSAPGRVRQSSSAPKRSNTSKPTGGVEVNAALVIRQILQRPQFGDVKEYLQSATKSELFQQALVIAQYAQEMKLKQVEISDAVEVELADQQSKYHAVTSDLIKSERSCEEHEKENNELLGRLNLAQEECQSLIVWIREHEDKFMELERTKQDQTQLIEEMSEVRRQRDGQLQSMAGEREQVMRFAEGMQEQNGQLKTRLEAMHMDSERLQHELQEERAANKNLSWELQQKTQTIQQISSELEDAKNQVLTLQGQIQLEAISRQSVTQERDSIQQQYRCDREEWKSTQTHRDELEQRKAQEFRKMDLEIRYLNQTLSRLRIEWESEKSQREKSEERTLKLATLSDKANVARTALEEEVQNLKAQINEEKATRETKEHALEVAYRDLQSLHKSYREEESAKLDAQNEVSSLIQRMKAIRRDHLALLHRVEAPAQLAAQWQDKVKEDQRLNS